LKRAGYFAGLRPSQLEPMDAENKNVILGTNRKCEWPIQAVAWMELKHKG
jgi:hypothetical protein